MTSPMHQIVKRLLGLGPVGMLCGCLMLNYVDAIEPDSWVGPAGDRTVLLLGIQAEEPFKYPASVSLHEYDPKTGKISGTCFHYYRVEAAMPPGTNTQPRYFAFDVPAMDFIYLGAGALFEARPGTPGQPFSVAVKERQVNYLGTFVWSKEGFTLTRDLETAKTAAKEFKSLHKEPVLAEITYGRKWPGILLCFP
jgi:hypothetical protein